MTLNDYLAIMGNLFSAFPLTVVDFLFLGALVMYVLSERNRELLRSLLSLLVAVLTWLLSFALYSYLATGFQKITFISKGVADGIALLCVSIVIASLLFMGYRLIILNASDELSSVRMPLISMILGGITFMVITGVLVTLLLTFPVASFIKLHLSQSVFAHETVQKMADTEVVLNRLLRKPLYSLLNYQTLDPDTSGREVIIYNAVPRLEEQHTQSVARYLNETRMKYAASTLNTTPELNTLAGSASYTLAQNRYLSRNDIQGFTVYDLLDAGGVEYTNAYMITVYTQDFRLGIDRLLDTDTYRKHLLDSNYRTIGIGVTSLKEYGYILTIVLVQ